MSHEIGHSRPQVVPGQSRPEVDTGELPDPQGGQKLEPSTVMGGNLSGKHRKELHDALCDAFPTPDYLALAVWHGLNQPLSAVVTYPMKSLSVAVSDLIQWAEARGIISDLIRAAYGMNPSNPQLRSLVEGVPVGSSQTLSEEQRWRLSEALATTFTLEELDKIVAKLGTSLAFIISRASLASMIMDVIVYSVAQNRLTEFLSAAFGASHSPWLYAIAHDLGIELQPRPNL